MQVWNQFETFIDEGLVKFIGLSNLYQPTALQHVLDNARIKPTFM
jgi:diketogulonate reductase-like aldo/keto reductase